MKAEFVLEAQNHNNMYQNATSNIENAIEDDNKELQER